MAYASINLRTLMEKNYAKFQADTKVSVQTMVNTFERKKNAYNIKNSTKKKSGLLDMNRIVNYKTSENIFSKKTLRPGQKNHKVMILIDWSGSIDSILEPIVCQAINVAQFCKKCGIDFSVYGFADNSTIKSRNASENILNVETNMMDNNFALIEFLTDKMSVKEFSQGCEDLYFLSNRETRGHLGPMFQLNGTPLNEALVAAREIIHEERSKYQSYNLVVLTDGDSCKIQAANNDSTGGGYFFPTYIDGKNNKAYDSSKDKNIRDGNEYGRFNVRGETSFLLGLIKNDLKVKNFVFHFFGGRPNKDYTRHEVKNVDKKVYFLGQNIFKNVEEFFYCDARAMFTLSDYSAEHLDRMSQEEEIDWDDVLDDDVDYDFDIKQGMSQKQIEKEFTKVLSSDKVKRLVASTLVGSLCEAY